MIAELASAYSVSQPPPPRFFLTFFPERLGIFSPNFTHLLHIPMYARLQILIQLSPTVTKLYAILSFAEYLKIVNRVFA